MCHFLADGNGDGDGDDGDDWDDDDDYCDDYESFLHQLKNVKYGYCSEGDIHLVATYLSLNIVPVVDSDWLLDLERGVHYETKEGGLLAVKYEEYVANIENM